ncbi:hypothetical protein CMV_015362 [Castanea mollissima]|uniref:ADP-ribosylation factor n=1 Tax=Castanea mollissima TaxID=60419 RepID=A0A8J4QUL0_9ROSI|nr:hypothetical protein CMV_015362 [Castanea mollissima]
MHILMVGLHAAGKTTILYQLKLGEIVTTFPTIATGTLKGYDQLLNLVLDEAIEFLRALLVGFPGTCTLF